MGIRVKLKSLRLPIVGILEKTLSRETHLGYSYSPRKNPGFAIWKTFLVKWAILFRFLLVTAAARTGRRNSLTKLRRLQNGESHRLSIVIANGESASLLEPSEVRDAQIRNRLHVFVMNRFFLTDLGDLIEPDFYVLSDPAMKKDIEKILTKYSEVKLFVPRDWILSSALGDEEEARLLFFEDQSLESWGRSISPVKARRYMSLTALKTMAIAGFFGYQKIGLIGLDADLHKRITVTNQGHLIQFPGHLGGAAAYHADQGVVLAPLRDAAGKKLGQFTGASDYFYSEAMLHYFLEEFFAPAAKFVNLSHSSDVTAFPFQSPRRFFDECLADSVLEPPIWD